MRIKRCVSVAAALLAVCTVAYLCKNRPSVEADDAAAATRLIPSVTPTSAVAAKAVPSAFVLPTNQTATVRGTKPYILTSERRFGQNLRLAAEALGVRTVGVLSQHELLIEADADARVRLAADKRFSKTIEFLPREKVEPALFEAFKGGAESVEASIITLSAEDRPRVKARIVSAGGEILTGCVDDGDSFGARLSANLVARLAGSGDVRWMERFVRPHLMNNLAVTNVAMNVQEAWNVLGLSGDGQFVSTSDSGIDTGDLKTLHEDLRDRVVAIKVNTYCSKTDVVGHGTHTAGSIVGTGKMWTNETGVVRGTAYGAKLYAWFCGYGGSGVRTPSTIGALFRNEDDEKEDPWPTFIHSASWGSDVDGKYDNQCRQIDTYVWSHPDFLPVFSAGNSGSAAQTIGSPAAAKNVLAVGATQNLRTGYDGGCGNGNPKVTAEYSSRGPCQDGRIKPDIAAPGTGILSTRAHDVDYDEHGYGNYDEFYAFDTGTSMACPLTAGAVALVREWLMRDCGFTTNEPPTAALMKAIITGGAKDAARPNSDQGWGRVDLMETLSPSNRAVKLFDRIPFADGEKNFTRVLEITNAAPLDVQLVWIDYPAVVRADATQPVIVNDLDLVVTPLDGEGVFYGNGGAGPDATNTVESVRIASAAPGKYVITVKNTNVAYDHTSGGAAALYIRGAFDPEAEMEELMCVSNRMAQVEYSTLDEALTAACDGETLEVFRPVDLHKPFTITNGVMIVAAGDPSATPVTCRGDATLAVAVDARLSLSNVVFAGTSGEFIRVATNGVLSVAGTVEIPGAMDGLTYVTVDGTNCFNLAGPLDPDTFIAVRCDKASAKGAVFGQITCEATPDVKESAKRILNWHDGELGGSIDGTNLKWDAVPIDPRRAFAYSTEGEGEYFLRLSTLLAKHTSDGVIILRDCAETVAMEIKGDMWICSTNDPALRVTLNGNAVFHIENDASLVVSNVVVSGVSAEGAFVLDDGKLTLEGGATIEGMKGDASAVVIKSGTVTMRPNSAIIGCQANGSGAMGGAISLVGTGCVLNLEGGEITECYAADCGGGVYAGPGAEVNLSGPLTVYGNSSGNSEAVGMFDDIYAPAGCTFTLKGNLTGGRIGVAYLSGAPDEGEPFIANAVGEDVTDHTLDSFVNEDFYGETDMMAALSEDGESLVWILNDHAPDTERTEDHVAQIVREDGAVTNYFRYIDGPDGAFAAIEAIGEDGLAVELLNPSEDYVIDFVETIKVSRDVTLRLADEVADKVDAPVYRTGDSGFEIQNGGKLTVDGVKICGYYNGLGGNSTVPLLHAKGGELVLTNDTLVTDVQCSANRGTVAVAVSGGGTFTMTEGVEISNCSNSYKNDGDQTGVGAGLLVDKGTAYLRGGRITANRAYRAAGVFVGNEGVAYVNGDMFVKSNTKTSGGRSDFAIEEHGQLYLDGLLLGSESTTIGIEEGIPGALHDTNVFGRVSNELRPEIEDYVGSAARFFRDKDTADRGQIATNATEALLVWSSAMPNGVYTNADGKVYGRVDGQLPPPPPPPPEPQWEVVTNHPSPIAFKSIDRVSDTEWRLVITDRVEYCNYRLLWTTNLVEGFISTGAWEHAVGPAADPVWTTNVITTGGVWFWRAEGADGTNMVLKTEE